MQKKEYSVLMSVYAKDRVEYVKVAIDSMLSQTIRPNQFVIVEDGPLEVEVEGLLQQYQKEYSQIFTIIKLDVNQGLANALNIGLKNCRNELVARMDADDISLPNRCERELQMFFKYPELVICGCNIDEFYDVIKDIRTSRIVPSEYEDILKFSRRRQPFNHPTVMYKKSVIEKNGGYPKLRRKEDFDLFSRVIINGNYVRNINESLYLYRADENNYLRRKSKENMMAAIAVYRKHLKRKGCTVWDFIVICGGEILFFVMPVKIMKIISNKLLRKKYGTHIK